MEMRLSETPEQRKEPIQQKVQGNLDWVKTLAEKVEKGIIPRDVADRMIARALTVREIWAERATDKSRRDPLTGLFNKGAFEEEYKRAVREGSSFALLIIDVDNFKLFNESYGHLTGDRVLIQVALHLSANLRQFREEESENDTIFRWGGEEFAVIVKKLSKKEDLEKVAEKLRKSICEQSFSVKVGDRDIYAPITISIGGGVYRGEGKDPFFEEVDRGLGQAKNSGKNKAVIINN